MSRVILLIIVFLNTGCSLALATYSQTQCRVNYADTRYEGGGFDLTHYAVALPNKSPRGIPIGPGVDGKIIDDVVSQVEQCMNVKIESCGIRGIMFAPDWEWKKDEYGIMQQVFPCKHNKFDSGWCYGVNQSPATLIITPNYSRLAWELVRMLTKKDPIKCYQIRSRLEE